jgi:hypothetical protein
VCLSRAVVTFLFAPFFTADRSTDSIDPAEIAWPENLPSARVLGGLAQKESKAWQTHGPDKSVGLVAYLICRIRANPIANPINPSVPTLRDQLPNGFTEYRIGRSKRIRIEDSRKLRVLLLCCKDVSNHDIHEGTIWSKSAQINRSEAVRIRLRLALNQPLNHSRVGRRSQSEYSVLSRRIGDVAPARWDSSFSFNVTSDSDRLIGGARGRSHRIA